MKQERQTSQPFDQVMPKFLAGQRQLGNANFAISTLSVELLALYSQVVPQHLNSYTDWFNRGEKLANLGLYREALESFNQAIASHPTAEVWVFQGVMLLHLNQPQTALDCCDRALALNSNNREAWIFRGVALTRLGYCKLAYASYSQATRQPHLNWWQKLLGWLI